MKWTNHELTAGITAIAVKYNMLETVLVVIGAYLPDYIEMMITKGNKTLWNKMHRTIFHWWILYLGYIAIIQVIAPNYAIYMTRFIAIGAYFHVLCDAFTIKGVPLLNPFKQEVALGYFKTGSNEEYKYTLIYTGALALFIYIFEDFSYQEFISEGTKSLTSIVQGAADTFAKTMTSTFTNMFIHQKH